jgi:hypothetical protein
MADYYLKPDGTGNPVSPYDTWAKAANNFNDIRLAGQGTSGPHRVFCAPGIHIGSSNKSINHANWANSTFFGVGYAGVDAGATGDALLGYPADWDEVQFFSSVGGAFETFNTCAMAHMAFKTTFATGRGLSLQAGCTAATGEKLFIHDSYRGINLEGGSITLNRSRISGNSAYNVYSSGVSTYTATLNECILDDSNIRPVTNVNLVGSGLTINFNHCLITGQSEYGISANSGICNVTNSIVLPGFNDIMATPINRSGGTVNVVNSYLPPARGNTTPFGGTIATDTGNIKECIRHFAAYKREAIYMFTIDDYMDAVGEDQSLMHPYVLGIESILASRGLKGTWYIPTHILDGQTIGVDWEIPLAERVAFVQAMDARGVITIGTHSHSHSDQRLGTTETANTFSITKASHTVNVNRAADTITIAGAAPVIITGFKAKTFVAIRAELVAGGCTLGTNTTKLYDHTKGEILADSAGAQASPYTPQILIDMTGQTGYYAVELKYPKEFMESILGRPVTEHAHPHGASNINVEQAAYALGYRYLRPGWGEGVECPKTFQLSNINLLRMCYKGLGEGNWMGSGSLSDEENLKIIRKNFDHALHHGVLQGLLTHQPSECSLHRFELIVDEALRYPGVKIMGHKEAGDYIANSGEWADVSNDYCTTSGAPYAGCTGSGAGTCSGIAFSKVYENHDDYIASVADSLLRGAGISIPSIHEQATPAIDLDGNTIHFLPPSIGPYDGQGDTKTITTDFTPTGYSVRGTAESLAKIKLAEHDLNVDLSGLTDAAPYIQVKAGSKRVAGFAGKGVNTYIKGSGGGSSDGIFGSNFG